MFHRAASRTVDLVQQQGDDSNRTTLTFRTIVTTDMARLDTLACAATVVGCVVCVKNHVAEQHIENMITEKTVL